MSARTPKTAAARSSPLSLEGALWMTVGGQNLGGHGRIGLLRAIAEQGSITQAAKAQGISYKAAWDAVDAMNRLAGEPLVERSTGGRGGGSTRLTLHGTKLVERFAQLEAVHARFIQHLAEENVDLRRDFDLLRTLNLKTSARNQWVGTVAGMVRGELDDEVELNLPGGERIAAAVTRESARALGLKKGVLVFALVKATAVDVTTPEQPARAAARNRLAGTVAELVAGPQSAEVVIGLPGGGQVTARVTLDRAKALGLAKGRPAAAEFEATSVILATPA